MGSLFDTGIRPAVDAFLQTQRDEERDYGEYWSASSAGYCMRRNIFERLKVPHVKEDPRKQRVFSAGHIFHDWLQGITKEAGLSIAQELELQDEELMIRGHIDDLILIPGKTEGSKEGEIEGQKYYDEWGTLPHLILYDYKTVHSKSFTYMKNSPLSYYHKMQLGTYMYMLRKQDLVVGQKIDVSHIPVNTYGTPKVETVKLSNYGGLTEARILKISKDDLRMEEQQLLWSEELSSEVRDYWIQLNNWWKEKKLPPCTCGDQENGFMAREAWNPYWYEGEPCSVNYYNKWKEEQNV